MDHLRHPSPVTPLTTRFVNLLLAVMTVLMVLTLTLTVVGVFQRSTATQTQVNANNVILERLDNQLATLQCILLIPPGERTPDLLTACAQLSIASQ